MWCVRIIRRTCTLVTVHFPSQVYALVVHVSLEAFTLPPLPPLVLNRRACRRPIARLRASRRHVRLRRGHLRRLPRRRRRRHQSHQTIKQKLALWSTSSLTLIRRRSTSHALSS